MNTSILPKYGNTGVVNYALDVDQIDGVLFLPRTVSINLPTYATDALVLAAVKAATITADTVRIRPYLFGVDFVDGTAEPAEQVAGFGRTVAVTHGNPKYTMELDQRGIAQIQELYRMEGNKDMSVIFYDKQRTLHGKMDAAGKMFGWPCDVYPTFKHATG